MNRQADRPCSPFVPAPQSVSSGRSCWRQRWSLLFSDSASAHEVRPAYLSVQEEAPNEFSVLFKTPMQGDARLALTALFSGKIENVTPSSRVRPATRWCRLGACGR